MNLQLEEIGDVILLSLDGRTSLSKIRDVVNEQVEMGKRKIVVDLREVSFIDSTGLGDLVAAYTIAKRVGGVIKLVSDTKTIDHLLDITSISSVIDKYLSPEEAIKSF
jgi:anti-sigma B factor antagonist